MIQAEAAATEQRGPRLERAAVLAPQRKSSTQSLTRLTDTPDHPLINAVKMNTHLEAANINKSHLKKNEGLEHFEFYNFGFYGFGVLQYILRSFTRQPLLFLFIF